MPQYHRNLTELEAQVLQSFGMPGFYKTKESKFYQVVITCQTCGSTKVEMLKMVKYTDGSWLKDEIIEESYEVNETVVVHKNFCCSCLSTANKEELIKSLKESIQEQFIICQLNIELISPLILYEKLIVMAYKLAYLEKNNNWKSYVPSQVVKSIDSYLEKFQDK